MDAEGSGEGALFFGEDDAGVTGTDGVTFDLDVGLLEEGVAESVEDGDGFDDAILAVADEVEALKANFGGEIGLEGDVELVLV